MTHVEAIENGVQFLNERHGEGWWMQINLDSLRVRSKNNCVVGQLHRAIGGPSYTDYFCSYGGAWLDNHGFCTSVGLFNELTAMWRIKLIELAVSA